VILVVPMCLLCSIAGVVYFDSTMNLLAKIPGFSWLARPGGNSDINIFTQIGFVVLVGLACKNAILIVEFAKDEFEGGKSICDAAMAAAKLRFRPILMTAFAFILGCVPLWVATGAGGVARQILGTVVIGGMLSATSIALFLVPVTFSMAERVSGLLGKEHSGSVDQHCSEIDFDADDGPAVKKDDLAVKNGSALKVGPVSKNGSTDKDSPAVKDGKA